MFDEKNLTLTNVQHISSMRKNLISLGKVDMKKFHWNAGGIIFTVG